MRCRRRRRDRLLHAGRIGAHGGAHLPEGPQGQGSRPMADYLCQTVLATHLCLDSLSPTAAAALPPSVPPKRKSTENLFCGRSHLRRRLHPATTRPSRDNIAVPLPPPRPSRFIWRIVLDPTPTPACAPWPSTSPACPCLRLATAPRCRDQGSWAAEVCFSLDSCAHRAARCTTAGLLLAQSA